MTHINLSKAMASLSVLLLAVAMQAQSNDATATSSTNSKVRIVRLSQVRGEVQIRHEADRGFESAMANLPIVERSTLRTGTGVAEVEFEDNSTLRLGPDSIVEFPQLERMPTGKTATSVRLVQGLAYVSLLKSPGNEFTLLFGERKLDLPPATHIRLDLEGVDARLAVLDGTVRLDGATGPVDVTKKKTVTFAMMDQSQPTVMKDMASSELDSWDHDAAGYHARAASNSMMSSPYSYGTNDMTYYGSFADAGCGSMWRPYFASAAWNPFSNGAWAWYGGAGYSWVSPYPWGWTPYHFGSWSYCSGAGWGWMPGGMWNGLNNVAIVAPPSGGGLLPHPPVHAPRVGGPTMMPVNTKPLVHSGLTPSSSFVFRKDSAGMGVPRQTLGRLDKLSRQADNRGIASTPVYVNAPTPANGRMNNNSEMLGASVHRGVPVQQGYPSSMGGGSYGSGRSGPGPGATPSNGSMNGPRSLGGPSTSGGPAPSSGAAPHR
jgi:FecR protein